MRLVTLLALGLCTAAWAPTPNYITARAREKMAEDSATFLGPEDAPGMPGVDTRYGPAEPEVCGTCRGEGMVSTPVGLMCCPECNVGNALGAPAEPEVAPESSEARNGAEAAQEGQETVFSCHACWHTWEEAPEGGVCPLCGGALEERTRVPLARLGGISWDATKLFERAVEIRRYIHAHWTCDTIVADWVAFAMAVDGTDEWQNYCDIAAGETGGTWDPLARGDKSAAHPEGNSYGLWQINRPAHGGKFHFERFDNTPEGIIYQFQCAKVIRESSGWGAWHRVAKRLGLI